MTGTNEPFPESLFSIEEALDIGFVAPDIEAYGGIRGKVIPDIDHWQAGDGEHMLQLAHMVSRRAVGGRGSTISGRAAFDFHQVFAVGGNPIKTRAEPHALDVLQAGRLQLHSDLYTVLGASGWFERLALGSGKVTFGFARRLLLFREQSFRGLERILAHDRSGVGRADTAPSPLAPGICPFSQVDDMVWARHDKPDKVQTFDVLTANFAMPAPVDHVLG